MRFLKQIRKLLSWQNFASFSAYGIGILLLFVGSLSIIQGITLAKESESIEIYNIDSDTTEIVVNDDDYIFDSLYNAAKLQYDNKQYKEAQSTLAKMDSEYLSLQKVKDLSEAIVERVHENQIPQDFVLVPSGCLKHLFYKYDDKWNKIYKDWDVDSFYISKFEVTQAEYKSVMGVNPSKFKGDNIPVHNLSNFDAIQYCQKRSVEEGFDGFYDITNGSVKFKKNGNGYRLPTDHEWAFAARSGDKPSSYAAGDKLSEIAWYGANSGNKPHEIAQKKPNGRGLYDMNGNVSELSHVSKNEIWPKGGSYEEWPYDGHVFHEDDARGFAGGKFSNKNQDVNAGMRLVFMPRGIGVPKDLYLYFSLD